MAEGYGNRDRKDPVSIAGQSVKPVESLRSERQTTGKIGSRDEEFLIDLINKLLTVVDAAGTERIRLGKLDTGATDYGIEVYDSSGGLVFDAIIDGISVGGLPSLSLRLQKNSSTEMELGLYSLTGLECRLVFNSSAESILLEGNVTVAGAGQDLGFYGSSGGGKPTVTGSRGGNAALASLLTELETLGLITDGSS